MKKRIIIRCICLFLICLIEISVCNININSASNKPESNTKAFSEQIKKLSKEERRVYEEIDKAIKNNKSYEIANFDGLTLDNKVSGYVKYDLNKDGVIDTLSYEFITKSDEWGHKLINKIKIFINHKYIINEKCKADEMFGSIKLADVNAKDRKVDFYIGFGYMVNEQINKFYYFDNKISQTCEIWTQIVNSFGSGKIYFWEGCIDTKANYVLDKNLVLFYFDFNKHKYILDKNIIGRSITFDWGNYLYKTKDDVICGAPVQVDEMVKMNPDIVFKFIKPGEKLTIISIDGLIEGDSDDGYYNKDNV